MSIQTRQSHYIVKDKEVVVSNQEIAGKKWKFDSIFKILSYILYGFFFGMLPATFKFANNSEIENNYVMIASIVGLLLMSLLSICIIYWVFKGNIKQHIPFSYAVAHLINAVFLSVGILLATILYPLNSELNLMDDLLNRQFLIMIYYAAWAILMPLIITAILFKSRKQFPLSWSKTPFAIFTWFILAIVQVMTYLSQYNNSQDDQKTMYLVISLVIILLAAIAFLFSIIWIKRFRDILLGERTEFEIQSINDWESAKILSIISSFVAGITFLVAFLWSESINFSHFVTYIDFAINGIVVIAYLWMVIYIKTLNSKNKQKLYRISRFFKSIDNTLLLEMLVWVILVKTVIIQGVFVNENSNGWINEFSLTTIASFGSIILLYVITVIASLNVPNLRNTAASMIVIAFSAVLEIFTIVFNTALKGSTIFMPLWLTLFMMLVPLIGISISLIIKISTISKIFKTNTTYSKISEEANEEIATNVKGGK